LSRISVNVDVILLQETWLSDAVSSKIDDALPEFLVFHSSAMEYKLSCNMRCGRPFGGTAVLIRKQLADYCYVLNTNNPRISAVCCQLNKDVSMVFGSVYCTCRMMIDLMTTSLSTRLLLATCRVSWTNVLAPNSYLVVI